MKNKTGYRSLYKTHLYEIGCVFEDAYLINTNTSKSFHIGSFYGDPTCAFISNFNWSVVGGNILILIKDFESTIINEIQEVFVLRPMDENAIQILTDPWSENSSIWQLNVVSLKCEKIQSFDKYNGKEYTENIDW